MFEYQSEKINIVREYETSIAIKRGYRKVFLDSI